MILVLLQAALPIPLGAIGPQALPPTGCAAYLWSRSEPPQLVANVTAEPGVLRVTIDNKPVDLARISAEGTAARGLPAVSRYAAGDVSATLELVAAERPDLSDGAMVPVATLTLDRAGKDTVIAPLAGMIGCASAK